MINVHVREPADHAHDRQTPRVGTVQRGAAGLHTWRQQHPLVIASEPVSRTGPEKLSRPGTCTRGRHMKPLGQGGRLMWGHGCIPQPAVQTTASDPGMA